MEVKDKQLYHFHRTGMYDYMWKEGNTINVDYRFENIYLNVIKHFNTNVKFSDKYYPLDSVIKAYMDLNKGYEFADRFLFETMSIISSANILKRELALEIVRKKYFPNLPSRRHCIWVTDEDGIEFWGDALDGFSTLKLYKVSLNGILFKSSDYLIPSNYLDFNDSILASFEYWHPDFSKIPSDRNEYLFMGKVKINTKM